jgi:hypothetical protein
LPAPCFFVAAAVLAHDSLGIPWPFDLAILLFLLPWLWIVGVQAFRSRQRWQRITMLAAANSQLPTPTLKRLAALTEP